MDTPVYVPSILIKDIIAWAWRLGFNSQFGGKEPQSVSFSVQNVRIMQFLTKLFPYDNLIVLDLLLRIRACLKKSNFDYRTLFQKPITKEFITLITEFLRAMPLIF